MPNFLIIGSGRSGTTSLHNFLGQHPEIYVSPFKETNYFAFEGREHLYGGPGARWLIKSSVYERKRYEALFEDVRDEKAIGESSPRYLYTPESIERISRELPDVKLIAILRNPVERAFASFVGLRRDGWEPSDSFFEALDQESQRVAENWVMGCYTHVGYYFRHLSLCYELFPPDQIKIYLHEDFRDKPTELLQDVYSFLGVDGGFIPDMSVQHNVTGIISNPILRAIWTETAKLRAMLGPMLPYGIRNMAGKLIVRNLEKPEFPVDARRKLTECFREDVTNLQGLIDRDLSHWLV